MKIAIFSAFLVLFMPFLAFSQIKGEIDSIIEDYRAKETQKIRLIIDKNKEKRGLAALSLLPNMSILQQANNNQPVVSAGINISNISVYFQQKRLNNINLELLEANLMARLETKIDNLQNQLAILEDFAIKISLSQDLLEIEKKLLEIRAKKYEKNDITLESWLLFQADFINKTKQSLLEIRSFETKKQNLIHQITD
jgi:hypothetical protein